MTALPPECVAALLQLDALRQGELSPVETATLRQHLAACRYCLCVERFEQAFLDRLRAAGQSCTCPDALRTAVRAQCVDGAHDC